MQPHVEKIFQGEYDVPYESSEKIVILDIGANVGGFACWSKLRWPNSKIYCFEPLKENFKFLQQNTITLDEVHLIHKAVGDPAKTKLFLGKNNCGENSFFDLGEQRSDFELVETLHPSELPKANVLKIDTEGSEWDILSRMSQINFDVILLEYHSEEFRRNIDALLSEYCLIGGEARTLDRGILKYIHKSKCR